MRLFIKLLIILIFLPLNCYAVDLPPDLKDYLLKNFPGIVFKIDNSFAIGGNSYIPLVPKVTRSTEEIELVHVISKGATPILFWFSNDWVFVKLNKLSDGTQTIINLDEIPSQYKERFLKTKFPNDLVIPKGLFVKEELKDLAGDLPIKIIGVELKEEKRRNGEGEKEKLVKEKNIEKIANVVQKSGGEQSTRKGILYLTSPDTGKIVYLNLSNISMVNHIQTMGAPFEIAFENTNKSIFVTDFAKDLFYEVKSLQPSISRTFELSSMSSPRDINISSDGSLAFLVESVANDFAVYNINEGMIFVKTKLPTNPTNFAIIKQANLIVVSCPSINTIVFLNATDFSISNQIMIDGGPEKVITDSTGNHLYVANRNNNSVSIIDVQNKKVLNTIQVGEAPTSLALDLSGKTLYVGNGKSSTISIINLETSLVTDTINLPVETQFPGDIEITQDGKWLIVTSETTNTISIIDLALKKIDVKLDVGATTHAALVVE